MKNEDNTDNPFNRTSKAERVAKTARYKVWVMVRDANDGEVRVVPRAHSPLFTRNTQYTGAWSIAKRGAKDDLRMLAKLVGEEWIDEEGHLRYTSDPDNDDDE